MENPEGFSTVPVDPNAGTEVLSVGTAPLRMVLKRLYRSSWASNLMETSRRTAVYEQEVHLVALLGPV